MQKLVQENNHTQVYPRACPGRELKPQVSVNKIRTPYQTLLLFENQKKNENEFSFLPESRIKRIRQVSWSSKMNKILEMRLAVCNSAEKMSSFHKSCFSSQSQEVPATVGTAIKTMNLGKHQAVALTLNPVDL